MQPSPARTRTPPGHSRRRLGLALAATGLALAGCDTLSPWLWGRDERMGMDPAQRARLDAWYAEGARAVAQGDFEAAIPPWQRYVADAPAGLPSARRVRGYLTLVYRESARRLARNAAGSERQLQAGAVPPPDRLTVAVFPFQTLSPDPGRAAAQQPFNRGLVAMITADLARVPALTVLERERVDALLRELRLADSGLVDRATLGPPAALLGAGTVVSGTLLNEPGPAGLGNLALGRYRINAAAFDMRQARVFATPEADGSQARFFVLQKQIVNALLQALGITDIPAAVQHVHTRNWEAYKRFAQGLQLLAQDRFDDARQAFFAALREDPAFALADEALASVPTEALPR